MRKIFTYNFFKWYFLIIKEKGPQTQAPTLVSVHTDKLQPKIHNNNYSFLIRINLWLVTTLCGCGGGIIIYIIKIYTPDTFLKHLKFFVSEVNSNTKIVFSARKLLGNADFDRRIKSEPLVFKIT